MDKNTPRTFILDGAEYTVLKHIITRNFWEFYILSEADEHGQCLAYVLGAENELGNIHLPEIMPYVILVTEDFTDVLAPSGAVWKDEVGEAA